MSLTYFAYFMCVILYAFKVFTGWSFNLVPSLYGMAVLVHAKVTTLQFIFKNNYNLGSDYHFLMKHSGFLSHNFGSCQYFLMKLSGCVHSA